MQKDIYDVVEKTDDVTAKNYYLSCNVRWNPSGFSVMLVMKLI